MHEVLTMNLRHLGYFIAVADERHFGRAAERLHMAQPPLSQAIRRLEAELGVQLLHRTTRRVDLTDAGRAYLTRARAILADVDEASHEARRVAAGSVGRLAIGRVGSATYSLLPELSRHLATELPGEIDVALLRPPVDEAPLTVTPLRRDRLVVAPPADHRPTGRKQVRVAEPVGGDLVVHSADRRSVMYGVVLGLLRDAGVEPRIRHEVGETSTPITLVAGGLGPAVVPEPVTALALAGVVHRPLVRPAATAGLAVAHRPAVRSRIWAGRSMSSAGCSRPSR
ncbi:LysR family transcriptional regulator [Streptomyces sp. NPDC093109]|uniref:LysR family transcriptional regulator n=1 Tax=Streptomyces sp. NPDC093109 TaxID=3154977 RepID=UPI00344EB78D